MKLLSGFHKHHIIPRYQGGSDAPENLVLLHPIDHAIAHLVRYRMYGNIRDLWASNWLQKIEDADVYTRFSVEREAKIKERRQKDPEFDQRMRDVRSRATTNRQEGYQVKVGETFRQRMSQDVESAAPIKQNRRHANQKSLIVRRAAAENRATQVRLLRSQGKTYAEIQQATGYSMGAISNILNGKMLVGVGGGTNAALS